MPGKLTTHVLDLTVGLPAHGMEIELWRLDPAPRRIKSVRTNADGRVDPPLLGPAEMAVGQYEIVFCTGTYFAARPAPRAGLPLPSPAKPAAAPPAPPGSRVLFLDRVPVRFGIADATSSYHVPLLVTPWGYSTYRGS